LKILKITLWIAGGLIVLVVAAVAIFAMTFDPNRYKGEVERIARERTGRTLQLKGPLEIAFYPSLGAKVSGVTLSERAADREFLSFDSAHASVALLPLLRGDVVVDRVRLSGLKAQIVKGKDGKFNFQDLIEPQDQKPAAKTEEKKKASQGGPVKFDIAGVTVERASVTYRDMNSGQEITLSDLKLDTGRIAENAQGKIDFSTLLKRNTPPLEAKLALNGSYSLKPQTIGLDFTAKLDESTVKGKLGIGRGEQASYDFDLNIDKINLDRYLASSGKKKAQEASPKKEEPAKPAKDEDAPVDLSGLKGLNAKGQLQIGALQVQGLKLANLKTEVRAAQGRAEIGPHSANLYEGSLSGNLGLDGNANRIALKETLSGIAVGPLLRDFAQQDRLDGKGNVTLDVTGAGATVNTIKRSLAGNAKVQLRDGAVKGINIGELLRKARSALGSQSGQADAKDRTDFSELSASFVIKNGVAHNEDLEIKAPLFRIGGAGDIDIGKSSINYVAKASVVGTTQGQGGKEREQLAGLTVPVRVVGPFDAMKYEVDYRAVAGDLAKSKVGEKAKEAIEKNKGKIEDTVRDRLKGLTGR
jgi:AsmA protein